MKNYIKKLSSQFKEILLSPLGWFSWLISNIIISLPWILTITYYFITNDPKWLAISASIWTFQMTPLPLETFLNIFLTIFIYNLLKGKPTERERDNSVGL
jgi:hypothetical protein